MQILKGHLPNKPVLSLAFSPDGARLASSARDYRTLLWDLATGKHQVMADVDSCTVAFSPDGKTVATGRTDRVSLWNIEAEELHMLQPGYDGRDIKVAFTSDSQCLILASWRLRAWDIASGRERRLTGLDRAEARDGTNALALTLDCALMASGHERPRKCVRLWDPQTWELQAELFDVTASPAALAFSPDGQRLAAAAGTTLWVWDVSSKEVALKHTISKRHFMDVAFSPDGQFLLFARSDATVRLWDTASWTEAAAFDWKVGPMVSVAFAPDGMRAAAGSGRGKIVVWDIDL
jgi:WD40 repeat protein